MFSDFKIPPEYKPLINKLERGLKTWWEEAQKQADEAQKQAATPKPSGAAHTPTSDGCPQYNIIKITNDKTIIQMAVPGFLEHDIYVGVDEDTLLVSGRIETDLGYDFLIKNFHPKSFRQKFSLDVDKEIGNCGVENGILTINLVKKKLKVDKNYMKSK